MSDYIKIEDKKEEIDIDWEAERIKSEKWAQDAHEEIEELEEEKEDYVEEYDKEVEEFYDDIEDDEDIKTKVHVDVLVNENDILDALTTSSGFEVGNFSMTLSNNKTIQLPLQVIESNEMERIRKRCIIKNQKYFKNQKARRKDPNFKPDIDNDKFFTKVLYECTKPNERGLRIWDNQEAWKRTEKELLKQGKEVSIKNGEDFIKATIKPGTITSAASEILEFSGYNDIIEEIKN